MVRLSCIGRGTRLVGEIAEMVGEPAKVAHEQVTNRICSESMAAKSKPLD